MLVANLYKLVEQKDGYFAIDGHKELLKEDVITTQEYIDDINDSSPYSGLYYEINELKTQQRDNYQAGIAPEERPIGLEETPIKTEETPTEETPKK